MDINNNRTEKKIKDIQFILKDLLKVIKVISMYPKDNPLPQSLRRTFSEKLEDLVDDYSNIKLVVKKENLLFEGEVVYTDRSKEESLANIFFESGITSLEFREGLDAVEIDHLLEIFGVYINTPAENRDLISLLWEANISQFRITSLEDQALSEYDGELKFDQFYKSDSNDNENFGSGVEQSEGYEKLFSDEHIEQNVAELESGGYSISSVSGTQSTITPDLDNDNPLDSPEIDPTLFKTEEAAIAMGLAANQNDSSVPAPSSPDTTLILNDELRLGEEDETYISQLITEDAEFDIYESTVELVKELLHQETDMAGFNESVTIGEKIISEMLSSGKLIHAGQILLYFTQLQKKIESDKPLWSEKLKESVILAGSREKLKVLANALNQFPDIRQADLQRFLKLFSWESLAGFTDLIGTLIHEHHRETLCDYLAIQGQQHSHIVAKGISDKRWEVVQNTVIVLCRIGDKDSLKTLQKVVKHGQDEVRKTLVTSLVDCRDDGALSLLQQMVSDREPSIRREAVSSIVKRRGPEAFNTTAELINNKSFAKLDRDDQQAILNAYSILGGDQAVEFLSGLIKKTNLFRNSNLSFFRQAAFEALSQNRSERCERVLLKFASSWNIKIKNGAVEALNKRRNIIFGESNNDVESDDVVSTEDIQNSADADNGDNNE